MNNKGFYLIVAILLVGVLVMSYSLIFNKTPLADVAELVPLEHETHDFASNVPPAHEDVNIQIEKVSTPLN